MGKGCIRFYDISGTKTCCVLTLKSSTSGSTGPPKIIVYKNQVAVKMSKFREDFDPNFAGFKRLFSTFGWTESLTFLKTGANKICASGMNFNGFVLQEILTWKRLPKFYIRNFVEYV